MESFALDVDTYSQQNSKKIIKKIIFYISLVVIIFFSVYFIIVLDTDWHRIGSGGGILEQLSYFVGLDFTIMKHLIVPTFETFLMACLGTMLGLFLSLPVAWLGARNVTPLGMASFGFARFLMTISRSVHEIIWAITFCHQPRLWHAAGMYLHLPCSRSASPAYCSPKKSISESI